ncbi:MULTISPECIES: hypothetical protein [Acinetobacter]|uniref:hypothetical protein n=1 Tax=Acinetobacter TaxID=469 RepID=UPI00097F9AE3|nr:MULTISPECIES: hypothetical protein [Acinetobacter]MEB3795831.1 hypothetical protein [Acinetobacter sp. IK24]MEB3815038.1 hypothetical protein [Acinetobacter sp. IK22]MEB3834233.1 hypothetical protein [Acinetobacter sp. IK23]MEB3837921.1 hypothetical protein [Acinetobacter sp. IK25]ONN57988.1 hypothetical protein AC057_06030 [Acinetobacter genomosp. 33YU]
MLKNKFVILAILPMMLSACGGGGSSDNNSVNNDQSSASQDSTVNGSRYYFMDYNANETDALNISYFEIFNKKSTDGSSNQPLGEYLLTEKKLYLPTDRAINVMNINSLTDWTLDLIGDVKEDWKLQRVNLSGQNMFDAVLPGYRAVGFPVNDASTTNGRIFLNTYGQNKFPEGSSCYRLISKKSNQESFAFNVGQDYELNQSFDEFDAENAPYLNRLNQTNPFGFTYKAVKGTWQNVSWTTIYNTSLGFAANDSVAVQYQGKPYTANYTSNIAWTADQEVKHWETYLKNTNDSDSIRLARLRIAQLKSGCYVYNETAARALVSLNALNWKPYQN